MEITNAVPPDHPEVRVSIGADAGTGATAHVRYFRNREPLPEGRQTIYRNLCRFRTKVPQMRHWAGSSPHLKNLKEPALACAASTPSREPSVVHAWTKSLEAISVAVSLVRDLQSRPL